MIELLLLLLCCTHARSVAFRSAVADYEQPGFPASAAIDGKSPSGPATGTGTMALLLAHHQESSPLLHKGWAIASQYGSPHAIMGIFG